MLISPVRARATAAPGDARPPLVDRRLARFSPRLQPAVRALAARHTRLADLAVSFPALLFALAVPRRGFTPEPVIARVIEGVSLSELAAAASLPVWLRRLPPEAFVTHIPVLPDGALFRRQIANHIPRSPKALPAWLQAVADAAAWGDEHFAIWVARHLAKNAKAIEPRRLRLLALWAWFSSADGTTARALIRTPFTPSMEVKAALSAAFDWQKDLELHLYFAERERADPWLASITLDGYTFVPLLTAEDLAAEAIAMENCLKTYGASVAANSVSIWGIRRDGQRVATLAFSAYPSLVVPHLQDVRGLRNEPVPAEIWWLAHRWLGTFAKASPNPLQGRDWQFLARGWQSVWRPYWLAKRRIPEWLPLQPSPYALDRV
jgi:hypothetical protein